MDADNVAGLSFDPLFSDGTVLQRDQPVTVWGTGPAGSVIDIDIDNMRVQCTCTDEGTWQATLPAHAAGTGYELVACCGNARVCSVDVAFGDVWLLAGQSNMELWLGRVQMMFPRVLQEAQDSRIHVFTVPQRCDFVQQHDHLTGGEWLVVGRDDISGVSALGYFFAQRIREDIDVPIGLVSTAVGGSHIEAWMSRETLTSLGALPNDFDRLTQPGYVERSEQRYSAYEREYMADLDMADVGMREAWFSSSYDDLQWQDTTLNGIDPDMLRASGAVWLRTTLTVPDCFVGQAGQLRLGTIIDANECYLNGELIGHTDYRYPPSNYDIASIPKTLTIALRVKSYAGEGELTVGKQHVLVTEDGKELDLDKASLWHIRRGCFMPNRREQEFFLHMPIGNFNAMIMPLCCMSLTGVLWYQGESNTSEAAGYSRLLMALIQEWRDVFGRPDLPFLFAQLPNYTLEPHNDWPRLRDEQRRSLALHNTAMIVTIGFGEDNDLHPVDKYHVGERFALAAESLVYGFKHESMGPLPTRATRTANTIDIQFVHVADGLNATDDVIFEIYEPGGKSTSVKVPCDAVSHHCVSVPFDFASRLCNGTVVRYAWSDSPSLSLFNSQGLPATPFEVMVQ